MCNGRDFLNLNVNIAVNPYFRISTIARIAEKKCRSVLPKSLMNPERHVVLVAPQIHWNTGNVGRTCLGTGSFLHLIKPIGFSLDDKYLKRAGLDYWPDVQLQVWPDFDEFFSQNPCHDNEILLFAKKGPRSYRQMPITEKMILVFGSETQGLPQKLLSRFPDSIYHIPIKNSIRSLNLSTAVGIALYESLRGLESFHMW